MLWAGRLGALAGLGHRLAMVNARGKQHVALLSSYSSLRMA